MLSRCWPWVLVLLSLVSTGAEAHGGALSFLANQLYLCLALLVFIVIVTPTGLKLAMTIGVALIYPLLFFRVFPALGSDENWERAAYFTLVVIVVLVSSIRVAYRFKGRQSGQMHKE